MQTTAERSDRDRPGLGPAGLLFETKWEGDPPTLNNDTFDRILRGMVTAGVVRDAICAFLRLTIEALSYHLVRLDLPAPSDRPIRKPCGKHPWTAADVQLVIDEWTANLRAEAIGAVLGRSAGSIWSKAKRIGLYRRRRCDLVGVVVASAKIQEAPVAAAVEVAEEASTEPPAVSNDACATPAHVEVPAEAAVADLAEIPAACAAASPSVVIARLDEPPAIVAFPATTINATVGCTPNALPRKAVKCRRSPRIKWTDAMLEEVARRWFAYQHHFGIAEDLGMTEASVRTQADGMGMPRRARGKIVSDYIVGRPYDTTLEDSVVKRRCILDRRVFWGSRNGPHTSPRAMKTKRYKMAHSGLVEAHVSVCVM